MQHLQLIYCRSLTVGGFFLRGAQWWAQWSHAGIVTPDHQVINARAFAGVVAEPFDDFVKRYSTWQLVEADVPDADAGLIFARAQIGAGYDYGALAAFITRKLGSQGREARWECIELIEATLAYAGRYRFRVPFDQVTPQQSFMTL